jgi:putative transposase
MPWKIISLVQGRSRLVKQLFKAQTPVGELCRSYGISRQTAYKWKRRFLADGLRGMRDRSRRPQASPRQTSALWVGRIRKLRQRHRRWGAKKIRVCLRREHAGKKLPAVRTITYWLQRLGLSQARRRRPPKGPSISRPGFTPATAPNRVWTVDFKGWFRTRDGRRVEPLTVRDLHSRFLLVVRLLPDQQWWRVQAVFRRLFGRYGLPRVLRMDNGGPFASTGPAGLSRLSVWWTALGIGVEFIAPGHPEQNGAHEQMHRVLKAEVTQPASSTLRAQQRRLNRWVRVYNQLRPHEALQQAVPARHYQSSQKPYVPKPPPWNYPARWPVRRVRSNGQIRWQGRLRFVGESFVGYRVGLQAQGSGGWTVYFGKILLGELRAADVGGLRPAVYQRTNPRQQNQKV